MSAQTRLDALIQAIGADVKELQQSAKVVAVPTGTTGFASEPDGTVWIEYTP